VLQRWSDTRTAGRTRESSSSTPSPLRSGTKASRSRRRRRDALAAVARFDPDLISVDGDEVETPSELQSAADDHTPGDAVQLAVLHERRLTVGFGTRPA